MNIYIFNKKNKLNVNIDKPINLIFKKQKKSGDIPWCCDGKTDPWDLVESAMGLTIGGYYIEAKNAYMWLKKKQLSDGSWYSSYINGIPFDFTREASISSYIAVGIFQYWLITNDLVFIKIMWSIIKKAINFAINLQNYSGEIFWAVSPNGTIDLKALLTASSSVFMSLKCAIALGLELGIFMPRWQIALKKLKNAILYKSFLFDSSKFHFSMDWFYPILCGIISGKRAYIRINIFWNEFIIKNLGIKCISNQLWITIAESSEFILSLITMNEFIMAHFIFSWICNRIFNDGSFWCGFTVPNVIIWPIEKITWNNAVLVMVINALYDITLSSNMFNYKWWNSKYKFLI